MRLIDADALTKNDEVTEWLSINPIRTGKMLKAFSELFIKRVNEMPRINAIPIPEDATNGEVLEKVFPMSEIMIDGLQEGYINFCMVSNSETINCVSKEWWNAPYKGVLE